MERLLQTPDEGQGLTMKIHHLYPFIKLFLQLEMDFLNRLPNHPLLVLPAASLVFPSVWHLANNASFKIGVIGEG